MSYGTDDGFTAWLEANGHTLPANAPTPAILRARGSAYVDTYEAAWTGTRAGGFAQDQAWPRSGATLNCTVPIPDNLIPPAVVNAAYRAAYLEAQTPGALTPASAKPGQRVKRQKVDVVEREFFDDGAPQSGSGPAFIDSAIDAALRQFVCDTAGGPFVWSLGS
jgi:hypothetical protein